jgi:hypothetical protein
MAQHGGGAARPGPATALLGEPTAARRWRTGDGEERRLTGVGTAAQRNGDGRAVRWSARHDGGPGEGAVGKAVGATAARARRSGGGEQREGAVGVTAVRARLTVGI